MNTKPEYLTTQQTADLLQVHIITVRKLLAQGKLPGIKVGVQWRINPADLAELRKRPHDHA